MKNPTVFLVLSYLGICLGKIYPRVTENARNSILQGEFNDKLTNTDMHQSHHRLRRSDEDTVPIKHHQTIDGSEGFNQAIVHWSGKDNSSVMFMLTRNISRTGSVYASILKRSGDLGKTYTDVQFSSKADNHVISYFKVSPLDPEFVLFVDVGNRVIYCTRDEGRTDVEQCGGELPFVPDRLSFSPYDAEHMLVYSYANRSVYVSMDGSKSWDFVAKDVNARVFWGTKDIDPPGTIHMEIEDITTDGYRYKKYKPPYSEENAEDPIMGVIDMDSLLVVNNYIFVQKSSAFTSNLYVSYKRQEFKRAYFPLDQIPLDFIIVSGDESQVFIAANHQSTNVNLYLSDETGQFYTLSLENVVAVSYGNGFSADIFEVKGLQGIFFANQHTTDKPRTLITFDQGGNWVALSQPVDKNSKSLCADKKDPASCSLHLHLTSSYAYLGIPGPTSEEKAPGLVIAQGTVGSQLNTDSSMFISRDGGMTWMLAHNGDFFVNILDQGGAIIAVNISDNNHMSKSILFSTDEGQSWRETNFLDEEIRVDGVLNEPGITSLATSIYGHVGSNRAWTVVLVDFSPWLTRSCTDADYETWSPSDQHSHSCLLGQQLTYTRQKSSSQCLNGKLFHAPVVAKNCTCIDEDFECDYGFGRTKDNKCAALSWFDPSKPVVTCPEGESYIKSSGYRKVASDKCSGGVEVKYKGKDTPCPITMPGGLYLSVRGGPVVAKGENVTFELIQDQGSKKSTSYSWNFDDGAKESQTGFNNNALVIHKFKTKGVKVVNVTASNSAGSASVQVRLVVEDRIAGIEMEGPHGVQVGVAARFDAAIVDKGDRIDSATPSVHYVFDFGDLGTVTGKPVLSWTGAVEHTYTAAGNYTATVQAVNALSSQLLTFPVTVYGTLVTVRLFFSSATYWLGQRTVIWNNQFALSVKDAVLKLLDVDHTRLEVVAGTYKDVLTHVDVSILPKKQTIMYDPNIKQMANTLVEVVNDGGLKIELDENDYGQDEEIKAVSASILGEDSAGGKSHSKNMTAVYVCVPLIIIVAMIVCVLVFAYYKRKSRLLGGRYRMLRSSSQRPDGAGESLLDDDTVNNLDDDALGDDDDVMLDPGRPGDSSNQRLAIDGDDPLHVISGRS